MHPPFPMEKASATRGELLWQPDPDQASRTNMARYLGWLEKNRGLRFAGYPELLEWSVRDLEAFWTSMADFFEVRFHRPATSVLSSREMPGARWFPGATLNYAEQALRHPDGANPAIIFQGEAPPGGTAQREEISRTELRRQVAALADQLRRCGVGPGDRVVGYLPNIPQTTVAFLAAVSLGAVWSVCPAELSSRGVIDRFHQIAPKVLFAVRSYRYGGKIHDRGEVLAEIVAGLPTLENLVLVSEPRPGARVDETPLNLRETIRVNSWSDFLAAENPPELLFAPVPFEHPLWILYSSGTTGIPKAIVQGHGGILLEHLKALALHFDLRTGDRFFWYTTAGWMMWNMLVSGLLLPGVTVVLYDGSPKYPNFYALWELVEELGVTFFGTSAPYLLACLKEKLKPSETSSFAKLRAIGSTGAPLTTEGFRWVYNEVKRDLLLGSASGGTDVCTAFILCHPLLPVRAGELQCRGLGAAIEAWDEEGRAVFDQMGELVLTAPFPSMPACLWNDPDGSRLRASYFEKFPGVWCHGDWIEIGAEDGHCVIHGRSDSTLNRGGVRMGSAEFYSAVEDLPGIAETLVIDLSGLNRPDRLLLFVALRPGVELDEDLRGKINARLRSQVSPRHVPDAIHAVPEIPHTLNGKKLEVPVKRILMGTAPEKAVQREAMSNPGSLAIFIELARTLYST
jgi:acetoacetyl-CoA synthetase